ncbi:calmodulin-binding protein 60 B isoform X2 [Amborella trichopoda]|uniref:Uncharacterized protein n=1 Tax=Amborella trichopoda TaxID=13333 RepID=W1PH40_AMBTC|nr:calmodulin-binding protein 60 B isoform X2 [Amborella trichopoda]ERN07278.1 hypothetical protein AMTR_s00019p00206980 [Amborella trichopoda]|eukprot:XP_006845603.1 calmodulin-binding protein 60 B isoform X2 [Amborella trichopoda]
MQRTTRLLERSNTMTRAEKRKLDAGEAEERPPEEKKQKVPALASVIVEALKVDNLQKLCSSLEPILRRVVSEEVERALAKLGPSRLGGRSSPKRIEGPDGRSLQLQFRSRLSLPLFTGGKVEGEQGALIHVVLIDANTGQVITSGLESSAKLDVIVLEGDFNNDDEDNWTQEEFESHVVKEREGKRPLLTGDLLVTLKEGVGTLGELTFTDNSSWIRSRKFRLGLKVSSGYCEVVRIREAKTEAFTVKDHRGELYKKHYPPALQDEVWRLEKIGKDGSFHKRLNKAGIHTVEDFLRLVVRDPQRLRSILGSGMSNKMWDLAVEHAKTCVLSGKYYVYYTDDARNGVVFNNIYELSGLIASGQYVPMEQLSDNQKLHVDTLVKRAYDNWMHVVEYDGKALLNYKQSRKASSSNYSIALDQQPSITRAPVQVPMEQSSVNAMSAVGGASISSYGENPATRYSSQPDQLTANNQVQFNNNHFATQQNQLVSTSHHAPQGPQVGLALGPPLSTGFQTMNVGQTPADDWARHRDARGLDDYFTEEEIRMRSSEMLENEDMQHLLRLFSMGGNTDAYSYPSYIPSPATNYTYEMCPGRPSGKAAVGWLKIKAALRWGIFVRKIAAEKRAQLVELDS